VTAVRPPAGSYSKEEVHAMPESLHQSTGCREKKKRVAAAGDVALQFIKRDQYVNVWLERKKVDVICGKGKKKRSEKGGQRSGFEKWRQLIKGTKRKRFSEWY